MKPSVNRDRKHFYEFDSFLLDETERLLLREADPVPLSPKAFEMLLVLVSNAGLAMAKEELMERVWPDAFVEEANLTVNISMLRKALGETPGGGQYIETLPRRGYRFSAEVREFWGEREQSRVTTIQPASAESAIGEPVKDNPAGGEPARAEKPAGDLSRDSAPRRQAIKQPPLPGLKTLIVERKPMAIALASAALIAMAALAYFIFAGRNDHRGNAQTNRLAVLPFANNRPDEETNYLGFALADSVINRLDYVKSLVVRPSSYVEKYANQKKGPEEIARELDVNTLLMGSYLKDGEDLLVNLQLIDTGSGEKLWSEAINVKYDKLLELQDYVARQVVKGLRLNLTGPEGERFARDVPHDPMAFEYFLRSRYLMSTNNHQKAIEMLTKSVEIDPNNALAWAYLARAYHINALQFSGDRSELSAAEADYDQALKLDSELPQARLMKAKLFTETGRVEQAVPLLLELVKAKPNIADAHWELSYAYRYAGLLDESVEEGNRALQIDANLASHQFNSYLYMGQYEKFINSLPAKEDAYVVFYRGFGLYYLNDMNQAAAAFDRAYELNPSSIISQIGKALRLAIADKKREGVEMLAAAEARIARAGTGDGEITYKLAQAYDALGDKGRALGAFNRSVEQGFFCYPYFASDALLKNIRGEAEFAVILEKARQRQEGFKRRLEEIR